MHNPELGGQKARLVVFNKHFFAALYGRYSAQRRPEEHPLVVHPRKHGAIVHDLLKEVRDNCRRAHGTVLRKQVVDLPVAAHAHYEPREFSPALFWQGLVTVLGLLVLLAGLFQCNGICHVEEHRDPFGKGGLLPEKRFQFKGFRQVDLHAFHVCGVGVAVLPLARVHERGNPARHGKTHGGLYRSPARVGKMHDHHLAQQSNGHPMTFVVLLLCVHVHEGNQHLDAARAHHGVACRGECGELRI